VIQSDRRFRFSCSRDELWEAIVRTDHYRTWWPWLRKLDAGDGFVAGAKWQCVVQPPLPYRLQFTIALEEVDARARARATISGDIHGTAELFVDDVEDGCEARMVSDLGPASPVLRTFAQVARPLVTWGHDWVLDQGAKQFRSGVRDPRPRP
jgi:hypothetical protein